MSVRADCLAWSAALLFLSGCAAVSAPQGGPRDVTPPKMISSSPANAARNVSQRSIRLVFSEAVQVKDLSKNLLITPQLPRDNPYKLREDRNSITLLFDKPLDPNTTYSFNFREGIVDITESLPARNARLSFSTGAVLDSGSVGGTVRELLTEQPAADVAVGLYRADDTASVRRSRPYYLARTDKQGAYRLDYLKPGAYRMYALIDKNNNGFYDDGERIAYLPAPVSIGEGDSTASVPLQLTRPDRIRPLLLGQQPGQYVFRLNFNEGVRAATLAPIGPGPAAAALTDATLLAERGRSLLVYHTPALTEGRYLLTATDSTGNVGRDTVQLRFPAAPVPAATGTRRAAPPSLVTVEGSPRTVYRQGQVQFRFGVPVQLAAKQPIGTLVEDSLRRRPLRVPADASLSPDRTLLTVTLNTKAEKSVDILLDSTAITAITGQNLGLRPLRLRPVEQASTGTLSGTITTKVARFELQLLNAKYEVVERLASPKGTYQFNNLAPGIYRLRVLVDADGDGRWRDGDPNLRLPAEPVYLHPKPLTVRANWEVVEKISF